MDGPAVTDDFMAERASQAQGEREGFCARSEGLALVTHNTRELECVPALLVEDWALGG